MFLGMPRGDCRHPQECLHNLEVQQHKSQEGECSGRLMGGRHCGEADTIDSNRHIFLTFSKATKLIGHYSLCIVRHLQAFYNKKKF